MSYSIVATNTFAKELKALFKKYRSIKDDLSVLKQAILISPNTGTPLGNNIFKIRLAIKSKGKGKSGGARVITYFKTSDDIIYLLSIYDKSEKDNLSDARIMELLKSIH